MNERKGLTQKWRKMDLFDGCKDESDTCEFA